MMPASVVKSGYGSVFTWNVTAVPECKSADVGGIKLDMLDASNMDSPDQFREYLVGFRDGGQIQLAGNWIGTAGQSALKTDLDSGTKRAFTLAIGSSAVTTISGNAFVEGLSIDVKHDALLSFSATLRITGKPTFA